MKLQDLSEAKTPRVTLSPYIKDEDKKDEAYSIFTWLVKAYHGKTPISIALDSKSDKLNVQFNGGDSAQCEQDIATCQSILKKTYKTKVDGMVIYLSK